MYDLSNIHLQQEDSSEEWHTTSPNEIHFIPRDHAIRKQRLFTLWKFYFVKSAILFYIE